MNLKSSKLQLHEYKYLAHLLSNNISLSTALNIIRNKNNTNEIENIIKGLEDGTKIEDLLFNDSDNVLFRVFSKIYKLDQAILMSVDVIEFRCKQKEELINKSLYPILIIFVSYLVMFFACFILIPDMMDLFRVMDIEMDSFLLFLNQLMLIIMSILICLIFLLICFIFFSIENHKIFEIYERIKNHIIQSIIQKYLSYIYFSNYYVFLKRALTTKEIQNIMLSFPNNTELYVLASEMERNHEVGMNLYEAINNVKYFDKRIIQLVKIGFITNNMIDYLEIYLNEIKMELNKGIKYSVFILQAISYSSVFLCVLMISNLLFAPLQILETI